MKNTNTLPASAPAILAALSAFAASRPGLDPRNYGNGIDGWRAFRRESADVTRDLRQARTLIRACELRPLQITADRLLSAFRNAYAGRLSCEVKQNGQIALDYCPGQYYNVEFRRAICAVLASALWSAWRDDMPSEAVADCPQEGITAGIVNAGGYLRSKARREFGRAIAKRWFD